MGVMSDRFGEIRLDLIFFVVMHVYKAEDELCESKYAFVTK